MILVTGILAQPEMVAALGLEGQPSEVSGRLVGGTAAGVAIDGWPQLVISPDPLPVLRCEWSWQLRRYADIFNLELIETGFGPMLGLSKAPSATSTAVAPDGLATALARWLLGLDQQIPAERLRKRLPQIAVWVASRIRAQKDGSGRIGPQDSEWRLLSRHEAYGDFFSLEEAQLRHRLYGGGWSSEVKRAVFVSGDAAVVLPWDPLRDRVLLIAQFRAAPALRGDPDPWLYEAVAGRVDAMEEPADAARREAVEEAGVTLEHLFQAPSHYPSPGAVAELLYLYVGTADLPDDITGIGGLDSEDEDIASVLVSRAELMAMIDDGRIRNGPLLVLGLWLDRHADKIRQELRESRAMAVGTC